MVYTIYKLFRIHSLKIIIDSQFFSILIPDFDVFPARSRARTKRGKEMAALKGEEKYTIGQMAELCNVSTRILRYYDQNGIVVPAYRDRETNYRYYTESQIEQILLLQELRNLSFPVKTISKLFVDRDLTAFETELEHHRRELQEQIAELQAKHDLTLDILLRVIRGRISIENTQKVQENKFQVVHFHRRTVVYTRYISYINVKKLFLSRRAELMKIITENKYNIVSSNMAIFHSGYLQQFSDRPEDECGDLEVFMEVKNGDSGKHCRVIEGCDAVSGVFIGPYKNMEPFYKEMEQYAEDNNIPLVGTSIEEYLVGATMTDNPNNYVTKIYLPIRE